MKINNVSLFNIGPYCDLNNFSFDTTSDKNIVLIGGKNGAGKTTLFKAIKFCLYGCRALGYEVNNQEYYKEIKKILNINNILVNSSYGEVTASISLENDNDIEDYRIIRRWEIKKNKISESCFIYQGDAVISGEDEANFESLMFQLIPPDLFNFYFFDGEKIFESLFNTESLNSFEKSFIKVVGLDNIDILVDNFKINAVEKLKNKKLFESYTKVLEDYKRIKEIKDDKWLNILKLQQKIKEKNDELQEINSQFSKKAVLANNQIKLLMQEQKSNELRKDEIKRFLKDFANNDVPYLILKNQLIDLLNDLKNSSNTLSTQELIRFLNSVDTFEVLKKHFASDLEGLKKELIGLTKNNDEYFQLPSNIKEQVVEKLTFILSTDNSDEIKSYENEFVVLTDKQKEIRQQLELNNGHRNNEYEETVKAYSDEIVQLENTKNKLYEDYTNVYSSFAIKEAEYLKIKKEYESDLKSESVSNLSIRCMNAFESLRDKLISKKIDVLKKTFIKNFNSVINKKALISGIEVTDKLNVFPYKTISMSKGEVDNILASVDKSFISDLYGEEGLKKMLSIKDGESIEVNKKILGTLSAGESQIYVIALYMSMIQISDFNIPLIIDTPFGRVDKEHRTRIIKKFFREMNNQVVILSTDEEIVKKHLDEISPSVSSTSLIVNDNGKSHIVNGAYFEV